MDEETPELMVARKFVAAIENVDLEGLVALCCDDIKQIEWPNRLNPNGITRDLAAMVAGFEQGREVLTRQTYLIKSAFAAANSAALEMEWRGELAIAVGDLSPGDEMVGHMAVFFTFRDGKIATCHNYDCFDAF